MATEQQPASHPQFLLPPEGAKLDDVEKSLIAQALTLTQQNQSAAARLLGVTRYVLRYRMQKHGLKID